MNIIKTLMLSGIIFIASNVAFGMQSHPKDIADLIERLQGELGIEGKALLTELINKMLHLQKSMRCTDEYNHPTYSTLERWEQELNTQT